MKRAQSFIRNRHKKGSFELLFLQCAEAVFRDGRLALEKLEQDQAVGSSMSARSGKSMSAMENISTIIF